MSRPIDDILEQILNRCPPAEVDSMRPFVFALYGDTSREELTQRNPERLCTAIASHWEMFARRRSGESKVRVYSHDTGHADWRASRAIVEIVTEDMPFLVDSVRMALNRHNLGVRLIAHGTVTVTRDAQGRILTLPADAADGVAEALVSIEVDRGADPEGSAALGADIYRTLGDLRASVEDWPRMRARVHEVLAELAANPPPVNPGELAECTAFLEWMEDHHFTFLGYRMYDLVRREGEDVLLSVPGSELGSTPATEEPTPSQSFASIPSEQRTSFRLPHLLVLTKANVRATVHRPVHMDYVGIKRFGPDGTVIGEHRFLGLYAAAAYNLNPRDVPLLRRKVESVIRRAGYPPHSHNGKALLNILETYPRDELMQIGEDDLLENAIGILDLQERQKVRLFVRRESFGRFVSCLVYLPRERYDTARRECIQHELVTAFHGASSDFTVRLSESVLARAYFIIHTPPGSPYDYDRADLESRITTCTRTWVDELRTTLLESLGEAAGDTLFRCYQTAFPSAYRDDFAADATLRDIEDMEELESGESTVLALYRPRDADSRELRFKFFSKERAVELSDVLPILENMDVRVIRERPYRVRPTGRPPLWVYDFSLRDNGSEAIDLDDIRDRFQTTFGDVWRGEAENDGFNRLVMRARLDSRQIAMLRAYAKYLRQIGLTFSQAYMEQALARNSGIAQLLAAFFHSRFDPAGPEHRGGVTSRLTAGIQEALDAVERLDDDRILRSFLAVILATVRTSFFQRDQDGTPHPYLSFKLDSRMIPELPQPHPLYEIFVYSPRTEGIHLRGGMVARGGIRWSDRLEDFRTEVLGLMKAQLVKNAIIVPVGAKGGFVVKRPPAGESQLSGEVADCYRIFMRGLLDLTDNRRATHTDSPPKVVRYDGDDSYLVVAADKGTASFSDLANGIAHEYGFWLDDAFASGGSKGYDHKKMGITARGAWESVTRHFRELGLDVQTQALSVVGIGDMSGDVFGNGMLCSRSLRLVAAFDHRHIFIDPDPDPATAYAERKRLFALPRSSWSDYDHEQLSLGGGIFPRTSKSITLSPQAQRVLGIDAQALTPDRLVRALLLAPVDLLWNGGIGTYIKARRETHAEVGDRGNDGVRVDASQLRCRVIAEGGNLGITQRGRVEFALAGGRVNTDFIDNAGGVCCSDYEVNIKILLGTAITAESLNADDRDRLLADMTDAVANLVLGEIYWQTWAITLMEARRQAELDQQVRFIQGLEREGRLDRALEALPDDESLALRRADGQGLTRPELAVLLTYAKNTLSEQLLSSNVLDDPVICGELVRYFPEPLRTRFPDLIASHPLRRELLATFLCNRLINRLGATFVHRAQEESGATVGRVIRAYFVTWKIFDLGPLSGRIVGLDKHVPVEILGRMMQHVVDLVERGTSWLLRHGPDPIDIRVTIERYRDAALLLAQQGVDLLSEPQSEAMEARAGPWVAAGVPPELARQVGVLNRLFEIFDIVEIMAQAETPLEIAARVHFRLDTDLELDWLRQCNAALPRDNRWQTGAGRGLEHELSWQHRSLTLSVLSSGAGAVDADAVVRGWWTARRAELAHYRQMISDMHAATAVDLSMLLVAVRGVGALGRRRHG